MADKILPFPDSLEKKVRRNRELSLWDTQADLTDLLLETPNEIRGLVEGDYINPEKLVIVNPETLQALIVDYIIFHLSRANISLEGGWVLFWVQYISDLLFKIFLFTGEEVQLIVRHPYFIHWMKEGFPKRAGDASVYSYMFRDPRSPAKREDYIEFAVSGYAGWSKDAQIPWAIGRILPEIWWMVKDDRFLKRGVLGTVK